VVVNKYAKYKQPAPAPEEEKAKPGKPNKYAKYTEAAKPAPQAETPLAPIDYGIDPSRVREMYDAKFKENFTPDGVTPPPALYDAPLNVAEMLDSNQDKGMRSLFGSNMGTVGPRTPDPTKAPISEQQLSSQSYWNAEKPEEPMNNPVKRAARYFTNTLADTLNIGVEGVNYAAPRQGTPVDEMGRPIDVPDMPQPEDEFQLPTIPGLRVPAARNTGEALADLTGIGGGLVLPLGWGGQAVRTTGQALRSTGSIGQTIAALTPQGTSAAARGTRLAGRLTAMAPEAAVTGFGAGYILGGENLGGDGDRLKSGLAVGSDWVNYAGQPALLFLNRAAIFIKTAGRRVTPEVVQVQRAAEVLQRASATTAQKEAAAKVIDDLTPPAPQPAPFSAPAEPKASSFLANNADRIVGGAVGGFLGSAGDAFASSGGDGNGGPDIINPYTGAAAGMFLPRAAVRGYRAAGSAIRGGGFNEAVAVRRVRNLLAPAGRSADEIKAANLAMYGDKPSVLADQTQNAQNFSVNLSRQVGDAPELASQAVDDLMRTRSGRLFSDVEETTKINPATVSGDLDEAIQQASEEISPAYEALFEKYAGVNSDRLMELADDPVVGQYFRSAIKKAESLKTTKGQAPSNARIWDLVKQGLDYTIQSQKRAGGQASYEIRAALEAVKAELDALMKEYKAVRDGADAPRMRDARKQGAKIAGGGLSVEKVRAIASKLTGKPLTALQMSAVEKIVPDIERGRVTGLASERMREILGEVFGQDAADKLVARIRAEQTIITNAQRRDPDFGAVTSQAGMADQGLGVLAADAFRAVRNPLEAALAALSRSGAYTQDQRNRIAQMLYGGATDENLARIYGARPPRNPLNVEPPPTPQGPPTNALAPRKPEQAGFGGNPEAIGAAGGAAIGIATAPDQNGDGVVDAQERMLGGAGGALTGGVIGRGVRGGMNALAPKPGASSKPPPVMNGFGGKSLPMDEPSRMQRAREQGFDVDNRVYHGSSKSGGFDEFQTSERGRFGPGVYFSEQPGVAGKYGEAKPYVVPTNDQLFDAMPSWNSLSDDVEQRIIKQLKPNEREKLAALKNWYKREGEAFWEALRRSVDGDDKILADARASEVIQAAGFKGIRGIGDGQETVIFNPKNVRSPDAAFDPSETQSSKLLAGVSGLTGLGVISAGATMQRDETPQRKPN